MFCHFPGFPCERQTIVLNVHQNSPVIGRHPSELMPEMSLISLHEESLSRLCKKEDDSKMFRETVSPVPSRRTVTTTQAGQKPNKSKDNNFSSTDTTTENLLQIL